VKQAAGGDSHPHGVPRTRVNLALQGGGAHGAFTWGVLDRILEDGRLEIEGISGTSAGAMNAAVLASGFAADGAAGARRALHVFWERIGRKAAFGPLQRTPMERMIGGWRLDNSPGFMFFDLLSQAFSPYQLNPFDLNPLKDVLAESVDFDLLRYASGIKVFVGATHVESGKPKVFSGTDLGIDAVLASACLPTLYKAVEIRGQHYYDGGYMGNPALWPLLYETISRDIVLVQINPLWRDQVPVTAREIEDRVNEISFNSSLMAEMRAIRFVNRLIDSGKLDAAEYKRSFIHLIQAPEMAELHATSKLNAETEFLLYLRDLGRRTAEGWLAESFANLGERHSIDIVKTFL